MINIAVSREFEVYYKLIGKIRKDGFVDDKTILVNCSPEYSSILTQVANHKLSYLIGNELFYQIPLEMPLPVYNQVFNKETGEAEQFDKYLLHWVHSKVLSDYKYLFLSSATLTGKTLKQVQTVMKTRRNEYRFAVAFHNENAVMQPDYVGQIYSQDKIRFQWENLNNPNK